MSARTVQPNKADNSSSELTLPLDITGPKMVRLSDIHQALEAADFSRAQRASVRFAGREHGVMAVPISEVFKKPFLCTSSGRIFDTSKWHFVSFPGGRRAIIQLEESNLHS